MPTGTKPSKIDLNALLKGLNEARVEFILVGGLAAVIQGAPVTTFDLDIVHRQTDKNIKKIEIGGGFATSALSHHPAYGTVPGGSHNLD